MTEALERIWAAARPPDWIPPMDCYMFDSAIRRQCDAWGDERNRRTLARGKAERYGAEGGAELHRMGVRCEWAFATIFGLLDQWTPVVDRYEDLTGDVGGVQVRGRGPHGWNLLLHPDDHDNQPYVLVVEELRRIPLYTLKGWIYGREGKRKEYWPGPNPARPCFGVPEDALLPMMDLYQAMRR